MVSSTSYAILRFIAWSFLPDVLTHHILRLSSHIPFVQQPPPPLNSPAYAKRYRYVFSFVVLAFLSYNLLEGARAMEPNFYELLGVGPLAEDQSLKLAFRQFAKIYHPDKLTKDGNRRGEEFFMVVRDAFEALKNPVVRFAYDRFGPDVLTWTQCTTTREYLQRGLVQSSGYHIITGAALLFWSAIGESSPVSFWRYLIFVALLVSELLLLLSPSPSLNATITNISSLTSAPSHRTILHTLFPRRVAYQHVLFLHQVFIALSIALSRVAPKLFPEQPKVGKAIVDRIRALSLLADRESSVMLHTELHSINPEENTITTTTPRRPRVSFSHMKPCQPLPGDVVQLLAEEMENMIIEGNVRKETGPLRSVWESAVASGRTRRKEEAVGEVANNGFGNGKAEGEEEGDRTALPSPVSPFDHAKPLLEEGNPTTVRVTLSEGPQGMGRLLPSPRPSPPPPPPGMQRRGSSFIRARSVSY